MVTNADATMRHLVADGLSFTYDGETVVDAVGLRLSPGMGTVLVGASGSGKTTILWMLAGLLKPTAGSIRLVAASCPDKAQPIDYKRTSIGMVFQHPSLWDHLTVEKHLRVVLAGKGLSRQQRRARIESILSQMRLDALKTRRPHQLSGGEQQRLAIARALVVEPEWLLLDEPLAHLDGPMREEMFAFLRDILVNVKSGVLLTTHNAQEAMQLADEIAVLIDGRIVQTGPPADVYHKPLSIQVAKMLGPATELCGNADKGVLLSDGRIILKDLPSSMNGPVSIIVRPEQLLFRPSPDGAARIVCCEFVGGSYRLQITIGKKNVYALHPQSIPIGTTGFLNLIQR